MFNLDLPKDGEGYIHRGGRTGRLGRLGKVVSIVTPAEEFAVRRLGNGVGIDIKRVNMEKKPRAREPREEKEEEEEEDVGDAGDAASGR